MGMTEMSYFIYQLISKSGNIRYIGQTQDTKTRQRDHKRSRPPHEFKILMETDDPEEAKKIEIELISKHNTYKKGWNKSPGGEGFEGYSRKGIGGVKKGNVPWNKGKKNAFSEKTKENWSKKRKGIIHSSKLNEEQVREIRKLYESKPFIDGVGNKSKNGKILTYDRLFSKKYHSFYNVTEQNILKIINKKAWNDV